MPGTGRTRISEPASGPSTTVLGATARRLWADIRPQWKVNRPPLEVRVDAASRGRTTNGRHAMETLLSTKELKTDARTGPLSTKELQLMNGYWRACNYLSVGMIYLKDNPLLREPLRAEHVKHRLLGHWGASPALSFVWVHLNRMIVRHDLDVIFVAGPGHGAPGVLGPAYLEGAYSEIYPDKS